MRSYALGLLATVSVACTGAHPGGETETTGTRSDRLVGATPSTNTPAVVVFEATGDDGGECTAEFISTTVLLTAAHCVLTEDAKPLTGSSFRVARVNDWNSVKDSDWITIATKNVHAHPQYTGEEHDVAVLVLDKPVDVKPYAWSKTALTNTDVGKAVRLIGYGASVPGASEDNDGFGIKRQLDSKIVSVQSAFIETGKKGATACGGDSGGPLILTVGGVETIVGTDSFSDAKDDCTGTEFYQRVDTEAEFISQFLTTSATPPASDKSSASTDDDDDTKASTDDDDDDKPTTKKKSTTTPAAATDGCSVTYGSSNGFSAGALLALGLVLARRRRKDLSA